MPMHNSAALVAKNNRRIIMEQDKKEKIMNVAEKEKLELKIKNKML